MQKRYLLSTGDQDHQCGRAATGLDANGTSFAVLPPHFDQSCGQVLSIAQWEDIMPNFSTFYPISFRKVCHFLLASLVYHQDWLKENLPCDHPLFSQRVWESSILNDLKDHVHAGTMTNPITKLTATGLNVHVAASAWPRGLGVAPRPRCGPAASVWPRSLGVAPRPRHGPAALAWSRGLSVALWPQRGPAASAWPALVWPCSRMVLLPRIRMVLLPHCLMALCGARDTTTHHTC